MKKETSFQILLFGTLILAIAISGFSTRERKQELNREPKSENMVVLELFTSQGCSSCPPADAILGKYVLENNPNILALSFHVDYWDKIGWKDPFSQQKFSERQRIYDQSLGSSVYTPQLIINGKIQVIGSQENKITALVNKELKSKKLDIVSIEEVSCKNQTIRVKYSCKTTASNGVVNSVLVKKRAETQIKRGENKGLKLVNYNIVTDFKSETLKDSKSAVANLNIKNDEKINDYFVAVYVQDNLGNIICASKKAITIK